MTVAKLPKLLIVGYRRHGKDFAAEYLHKKYGFKFTSSSMYAAKKFIYNELSSKYGYETFEHCFNDRMEHRAEWYDLITEYNQDNPSRLAEDMLGEGYDIYVGMRNKDELLHCKANKVFDYIIWVDAEERLGFIEDSSSCTIDKSMADYVIDNNGTIEQLYNNLDNLMTKLLQQ